MNTALLLTLIAALLFLLSWILSPHDPEPVSRDDLWHRADGVGAGLFAASMIVMVAAVLALIVPQLFNA